MKAFKEYVDRIEALLESAVKSRLSGKMQRKIDATLDGQPAAELRRVVSVKDLRASGAFFTGSRLARRALRRALPEVSSKSVVLDPACGSGDLLIVCASHAPMATTLEGTMALWADRFVGRDLQPEFVRATKIRLILTAIRRGVRVDCADPLEICKVLPNIRTGSSLSDDSVFSTASLVVVNPPFPVVAAPESCEWGSGTVNSAAVFMDDYLRHARVGARVVAILPEVLRSGSRYQKWRRVVEARLQKNRTDVFGRFDRWTDVDVFILDGRVTSYRRGGRPWNWGHPPQTVPACLGDLFDVSVGPVVPHRDPNKGPWHSMICPRELEPWSTVTEISRHRRFNGRTVDAPFVAVRRTSRPGDRHRAVGTIIRAGKSVAVENHLLVLEPKDGKLETCRSLLDVLRKARTNAWLNRRIRCRHLTVSALRELPWWEEGK